MIFLESKLKRKNKTVFTQDVVRTHKKYKEKYIKATTKQKWIRKINDNNIAALPRSCLCFTLRLFRLVTDRNLINNRVSSRIKTY